MKAINQHSNKQRERERHAFSLLIAHELTQDIAAINNTTNSLFWTSSVTSLWQLSWHICPGKLVKNEKRDKPKSCRFKTCFARDLTLEKMRGGYFWSYSFRVHNRQMLATMSSSTSWLRLNIVQWLLPDIDMFVKPISDVDLCNHS